MNTLYTVVLSKLDSSLVEFETECYDNITKEIERFGNNIKGITVKVTTDKGIIFQQSTDLDDIDRVLALAYFVSEKSTDND